MSNKKFIAVLDDDRGTGHSFFDPFIKDGVDPKGNHIENMIELALTTHGEERRPDGPPTGWALTNMKYLKKFRDDQHFRASATEAVRNKALELLDVADE